MDLNTPAILEFDIRGQICPSTLLVALREVNKNIYQLKEGNVKLLFKSDNRNCTYTIPEAVGNMGLKVYVQKLDGYYNIMISI